jgi:hypothetical protein
MSPTSLNGVTMPRQRDTGVLSAWSPTDSARLHIGGHPKSVGAATLWQDLATPASSCAVTGTAASSALPMPTKRAGSRSDAPGTRSESSKPSRSQSSGSSEEVHAHPTQGEALGEALLALVGKPFHTTH